VVPNPATLAVSVLTCVGSWASVVLKSSALKDTEVTAENNEKINPLKAKMQWVSLPEDDHAKGQNMWDKIQGCYFDNLCVHYPFFAIYFLQKFFSQ